MLPSFKDYKIICILENYFKINPFIYSQYVFDLDTYLLNSSLREISLVKSGHAYKELRLLCSGPEKQNGKKFRV